MGARLPLVIEALMIYPGAPVDGVKARAKGI
jgi:hypothetical protein